MQLKLNIMSNKKRKDILSEMEEAKKRLEEIERLAEEEKQESINLLEETSKQIEDIAKEKDLFCGVILTKDDILQIVSLAIDTKENISIPFKLYFKD